MRATPSLRRETTPLQPDFPRVRPVVERGVKVAQAAKDLGIHENVLRRWVLNFKADPEQSFPGRGKSRPAQIVGHNSARARGKNSAGGTRGWTTREERRDAMLRVHR